MIIVFEKKRLIDDGFRIWQSVGGSMNRAQLQEMIDLKKWYDSEANHKDMCGSYDFCAYCDKSISLPCGAAYEKANTPAPAAQPATQYVPTPTPRKKASHKQHVTQQDSSLGKRFDYSKVMAKKAARKSLTFAEKYALSSDIIKERYAQMQAALTDTPKGAPKIKSRISKQCDTYRRNGETIAKITIIGTSLRINLPLDPNAPEFNDGKTPHIDMGHKKVYEEVPFQFKVNSKLGLKRALALIDMIK